LPLEAISTKQSTSVQNQKKKLKMLNKVHLTILIEEETSTPNLSPQPLPTLRAHAMWDAWLSLGARPRFPDAANG
jgi:DNA-directed RNA polymerase